MAAVSPQRQGWSHRSMAAHWGALALLVRPAYIATEYVVASATTGGYSFLADSVSQLGGVGCSAAQCSPRHDLMNGSFIGFGALLLIGAILLLRQLGPSANGLLVISGLSSIATGLVPLDQDPWLHALVAAPLFIAQPLALIALGARLGHRPRLSGALRVTGIVSGAAAVLFVSTGDHGLSGALERLALWPVLIALTTIAWAHLAGSRLSRSVPLAFDEPTETDEADQEQDDPEEVGSGEDDEGHASEDQ